MIYTATIVVDIEVAENEDDREIGAYEIGYLCGVISETLKHTTGIKNKGWQLLSWKPKIKY